MHEVLMFLSFALAFFMSFNLLSICIEAYGLKVTSKLSSIMRVQIQVAIIWAAILIGANWSYLTGIIINVIILIIFLINLPEIEDEKFEIWKKENTVPAEEKFYLKKDIAKFNGKVACNTFDEKALKSIYQSELEPAQEPAASKKS